MKDCGSRSWIGEEGISSRDHTGQGEERTEAYTGGFQLKEATGECWIVWRFPYRFFHTHLWVTVETVMDIHGSQKGKSHIP
jgi:hypothetical protein